jgi:hypothetical protein
MRGRGLACKFGQVSACLNGVRACPCDRAQRSLRARTYRGLRARTYSGQRRRSEPRTTSFAHVRGRMEVQAGAYCKTVGSAYVGSNPTPATTCGNGPLGCGNAPAGPFPSCHATYQGVSPWSMRGSGHGCIADIVRRNERCANPLALPIRAALSRYPGAGLSRIPVGRFFAVLVMPGAGLALFVPAAGTGCRIGPRHLIEAPRRGPGVRCRH